MGMSFNNVELPNLGTVGPGYNHEGRSQEIS